MKKIVAIVAAACLLLFGLTATSSALEPERAFTFSLEPNAFGLRMSVLESIEFSSAESKAKGEPSMKGSLCQSASAAPCTTDEKFTLSGHMVAPTCEDSATNCISGFSATVNGTQVPAKFISYVGPTTINADPAHGLLATGKTASLWQIPGAINAGGTDTYMVLANYWLDYKQSKFTIRNFGANIVPYVERDTPGQLPYAVSVGPDGTIGFSHGPSKCAWVRKDKCGESTAFPEDVRFKLQLRMQEEVSNWFNARLKNPEISIAKFGNRSNTISIEAAASEVPLFKAVLTEAEMTPEIQQRLASKNVQVRFPGGGGTSTDHAGAMDFLEIFRKTLNDTTSATSTIWSISNLQGQNRRCLDSKTEVLGVVATNAMTYQAEPPTFVGGFLQYKVAGMHYQPNGTDLELGTYDLIVRSSVARCLFGLPKVPLSASVSIVNERGTKTTSTTVLSEKNGWIKLSAKGFTFSKKTIKVKITKKKK